MKLEDLSFEDAEIVFDLPDSTRVMLSVKHPTIRRLALCRLGPSATSIWWAAYDMAALAFGPVPVSDVFDVVGLSKTKLGQRALHRLVMFDMVSSIDPGIITLRPELGPRHLANVSMNEQLPAAHRALAFTTLRAWELSMQESA